MNTATDRKSQLYTLIALIVISISFAITYTMVFDAKLDLNGDNAHYLTLAHHLSDGQGYTEANSQGVLTPVNHFPPGYSFLLSLFMRLGIESVVLFKILNGLFMLAGICLLGWLTGRQSGNPWVGWTAAATLAASVPMLHFASMVMSEMGYMLLSCTCFVCAYKQSQTQTTWWRSPWFYGAILSCAAAYYFRTVAMSLILALIVFYLFRKEWKQAGATLLGIIVLNLPWILRNKAAGLESRYFGTIMTVNPWRPESGSVQSVSDFIDKLINNFDETVIKAFPDSLFPFFTPEYSAEHPSSLIAVLVSLLLLGVIFYGAWTLREQRWMMIAYLVGNIGLFALWHGGNGIRYVVPLIPWIVCCFTAGMWGLLRLVWKTAPKPVVLALLLFPMTAGSGLKQQQALAAQPYPPQYVDYFDIATQMQQHRSEHGKLVACRKPELFAMYAPDVHTAYYLYSDKPDEVIRDLTERRVDYVILDALGYSSTALYLYPAIQKYPELFPVVLMYDRSHTYLLRFDAERATQVLAGAATPTATPEPTADKP